MLMNLRKWIRCVAVVVASALLALSFSACTHTVNIESGVASQEYPVRINDVTLSAKPQKVAVLSASVADVILAIGYETSLSRGSEDCTQPELQVLQKVSATDTQAILDSAPDLVITDSIDPAVQTALTEADVPVLVLERAKNREDFERLYSQVGAALNGGATGYSAGIKAAQKIFSSLDDLARLVPDSNTVVTACYISDVSGTAVTGDELVSVMMSYIGLTNAFKGRTGGTFTDEDLRLSDPTMIFCTQAVRDQILQNTKYSTLSAVQNDRVYAINPNYVTWQGKTVYTAAIEMMGLAYPELTQAGSSASTADAADTKTAAASDSSSQSDSSKDDTSASSGESGATQYTALKSGDENEDVLNMQTRLKELGYLTAEYGGVYGEITVEAVKQFQTENGLEVTGDADVKTLEAIFADTAKEAPVAQG